MKQRMFLYAFLACAKGGLYMTWHVIPAKNIRSARSLAKEQFPENAEQIEDMERLGVCREGKAIDLDLV